MSARSLDELAERARRIAEQRAQPQQQPQQPQQQQQREPISGALVPVPRPVPQEAAAPGRPPRIGLVLAAGGAKGAYQVGVLERIAELDIPIAAAAGSSIGALNGAVVAAAPSLAVAAARLAAIWREVGTLAGPPPSIPAALVRGARTQDIHEALAAITATGASPVLRPEFLESFVRRSVDAEAVRAGLPLWAALSPALLGSRDAVGWDWLLDVVRARAGVRAHWLHVNGLPVGEIHSAILASAAIPPLLPGREVLGVRYRDGALSDGTPSGALAGPGKCDFLIVVHLNRGSLWDAHQHPGTSVLEIRPRASLRRTGALGELSAMLDFSAERIDVLRRQGYDDATDVLDRARTVFGSLRLLRQSHERMLRAVEDL